ncbi:MAG TPA: HAMP domain-containing sensor histidine kinase [Vicinamibacterales bacterium]|nr:HAMP domain-containing sensor histidine kinase [Vicinamibacterales bacterium]
MSEPADNNGPADTERDQTDQSLRDERDKADRGAGNDWAAIDETADAIISLARVRADAVLARARAQMDLSSRQSVPDLAPGETLTRNRAFEDHAVQRERAQADATLRVERAEHLRVLAVEREETDKDLDRERARIDEALATRDDFLGIVSHELRNLLGVVIGSAAAVMDATTSRDDLGIHGQRIQRTAWRMNRLVGDLIDVASIQAGRLAVTPERGDPSTVVAEAVESFQTEAARKGVTIETQVETTMSLVPFDAARILQVLSNLLSNAIKFTPTGGKVVVRAGLVAGAIHISITDTGVGIPPDKLEDVFGKFVQLIPNDRRGLGLGLYISKCIVQGHGGRIWAENSAGNGTVMSFVLPVKITGTPASVHV